MKVLRVKADQYEVGTIEREVKMAENKEDIYLLPRTMKYHQGNWEVLEALKVSREVLTSRQELLPTGDEMESLERCLKEVGTHLQNRNLSETYGVAFRLKID